MTCNNSDKAHVTKEYFVSYSWIRDYSNGFGDAVFKTSSTVLTADTIEAFRKDLLEKNNFNQCVILNIVQLNV